MEVFKEPVSVNLDKETKHCRLCSKKLMLYELFDWSKEHQMSYKYTKIVEFLKPEYLDLNDSLLPTTTCDSCNEAFNSAYDFMRKVEHSQIILKAIYNKKVKDEDIEPIIKTENDLSMTIVEEEISVLKEETEFDSLLKNVNAAETETKKCNHESRQQQKSKELLINPEGIYVKIEHTTEQDHNQTHRQEIDIDHSSDIILDNEINITENYSGKASVTDKKIAIVVTNVNADKESIKSNADISWASYTWICLHCNMEFENMADLRMHSSMTYKKCYAFKCMDCDEQFNVFNSFIEHVRRHKDVLRNYCQYCDRKFDDPKGCEEHTLTHWSGTQKICNMCGEIFPSAESLDRHCKLFKLVPLPLKWYRKRPKLIVPNPLYDGVSNWNNYQWTCQECCVQMPNVQTLRAHAQDFHNKCFTMKCMDCLRVDRNYSVFVKHARKHRPYLNRFCQYCNQEFSNPSDLSKHETDHLKGPQKPCDGCGQSFENKSSLLQHLRIYKPPRLKGSVSLDDKTCDICGKVLASMLILRAHRANHDKDSREFVTCHTCGKSYSSNYINSHIKTHFNKQVACKICNKMLGSYNGLRSHLRSHSNYKVYTCNECGKQFKTKSNMRCHLQRHMKIMDFKCLVCGKEFASKTNLKTHMNTHSTESPYSCTHCEKTFNSWGNCNKHMIRKHGVSLAKRM